MEETKYLKYTINENLSILDAMQLIEENEHRSLIVLNDEDTVVGTLSDGDIRKLIINRRLLSTKIKDVINLNFIFMKKLDVYEAKKIFDETRVLLIPILDDNNKLVDIIDV